MTVQWQRAFAASMMSSSLTFSCAAPAASKVMLKPTPLPSRAAASHSSFMPPQWMVLTMMFLRVASAMAPW